MQEGGVKYRVYKSGGGNGYTIHNLSNNMMSTVSSLKGFSPAKE